MKKEKEKRKYKKKIIKKIDFHSESGISLDLKIVLSFIFGFDFLENSKAANTHNTKILDS